MISVLIRVEHGVEALAMTLAALVPAVAEGLIGDAVVIARQPDPALETVADAVGAALLVDPGAPWVRGAEAAKRDWILCLDDGDIPAEGWSRALERFIALSPPDRRFGRLARRPAGIVTALVAAVRSALGGRGVRAGDLVHRSVLVGGVARRPARVGAVIERDPVLG
jgi:hypothetical protein